MKLTITKKVQAAVVAAAMLITTCVAPAELAFADEPNEQPGGQLTNQEQNSDPETSKDQNEDAQPGGQDPSDEGKSGKQPAVNKSVSNPDAVGNTMQEDELPAAEITKIKAADGKIELEWKAQSEYAGYEVEYAFDKDFESQLVTKDAGNNTSYTINDITANKTYYVRVRGYVKKDEEYGEYSEVKTAVWEKAPSLARVKIKSLKRGKGKTAVLKWKKYSGSDGFEIVYAKNMVFLNKKKIKITNPKATSKVIKKIGRKQNCYVKIRAFRVLNDKKYYSKWSAKHFKVKESVSGVSYLKSKKGKRIDIRVRAKGKLKHYRIGQGSATDGKYIYMLFEYRRGDDDGKGRARIKVAKVRAREMKVVKVSGPLKVGHGNDVTYNSHKKYLVITGAKTRDPYVYLVSTKSLKRIGKKRVKLGKYSEGGKPNSFHAIVYNAATKRYLIKARKFRDRAYILNSKFKAVKRIRIHLPYKLRTQGSVLYKGKFILIQSGHQEGRNRMIIYSLAGKILHKIKVTCGNEMEALFVIKNVLYGTKHMKTRRHGKEYKYTPIFKIDF